MTDLFFSYSSKDRDKVQLVRDAFAAQGFEVFWDQALPVDIDWDSWIRRHLSEAKCVIVFWSGHSIGSDNVRHEATVAKQQGKLLAVLLEPLTAEQFPMGLYSAQAARLVSWDGEESHPEWIKLREAAEARLMPAWVRKLLDDKDAELVAERARREAFERRNKTLQNQIVKEVERQQELITEHDEAMEAAAKEKQRLDSVIDKLSGEVSRLSSRQDISSYAQAKRGASIDKPLAGDADQTPLPLHPESREPGGNGHEEHSGTETSFIGNAAPNVKSAAAALPDAKSGTQSGLYLFMLIFLTIVGIALWVSLNR